MILITWMPKKGPQESKRKLQEMESGGKSGYISRGAAQVTKLGSGYINLAKLLKESPAHCPPGKHWMGGREQPQEEEGSPEPQLGPTAVEHP